MKLTGMIGVILIILLLDNLYSIKVINSVIFRRVIKQEPFRSYKRKMWKIKDELMNDNWDLEVIEVCSPVPVILCTLYT